MVYFKKGATGSRTTFGERVGIFFNKNVNTINFDFLNKYKRASYAKQINPEPNDVYPSKCVHNYWAQDVASELKKTNCFAPLRPYKIFMNY